MQSKLRTMSLRRDRRSTITVPSSSEAMSIELIPEVIDGRLCLRIGLPKGAAIKNQSPASEKSRATELRGSS